jgi:PII-like signaling protein
MTDVILLVFFVHEKDRLHGRPAHDWLLAQARDIGVGGGSAFRAVAGYGRHGRLHEDRFFELSGELAVQVEFVVSREQADRLVAEAKAAGGSFPYLELPCRLAMTDS